MATLYEDGTVRLDDESLTIKRYYFPVGLPKRVPYAAIRRVQVEPLTLTRGRWRLWGMDLAPWWFPLDLKRPAKERCVVLDVGRLVRPALTPDDVDAVARLIEERSSRRRGG